jgi:hypothetical protein
VTLIGIAKKTAPDLGEIRRPDGQVKKEKAEKCVKKEKAEKCVKKKENEKVEYLEKNN